jgi:hypothetical protein
LPPPLLEGEFDPPEDGVPDPPEDGELLLPPLEGLLLGGRGDTTNAAAFFSAATGELASDASDETLASFTATTVTEYWFVLSFEYRENPTDDKTDTDNNSITEPDTENP